MERDDVEISKAMPENVEEIVSIYKRSWLKTYPNKEANITIEDIEILYSNPAERIRRGEEFFDRTKNDSTVFCLVAKISSKVVAISEACIKDGITTLGSLYVDPDHKRKGIGGTLLTKVINWAQEEDIYLHVASYNEDAISFYKKFGFVGSNIIEYLLLKRINKYMPIIEMKRPGQKTF